MTVVNTGTVLKTSAEGERQEFGILLLLKTLKVRLAQEVGFAKKVRRHMLN